MENSFRPLRFVRSPKSPVSEADWIEGSNREICSFCGLSLQRQTHLGLTGMLEPVNQKVKRRTPVVRIFANSESRLRPVRPLAIGIHEDRR